MSSARPCAASSGSAFVYRAPDEVLAADELAVRVVRELEDQFRPGQIGHRDRNGRE